MPSCNHHAKEEEHDNKLAFLDVLLTKTDDGNLNTQVYCRKTHTAQLLNYDSNHPTQHKISCVKTLFNRIDTHCNTDQSTQEERKYLYSTFYDYSAHLINNVLSRKKQTNMKQPIKTNTRNTLPYIHTASEMASRLPRPFNIDVAHKPINKIWSNFTIGGPIQCVVSYRDQCAHKHISQFETTKCVYVRTDLYMKLHTELGRL